MRLYWTFFLSLGLVSTLFGQTKPKFVLADKSIQMQPGGSKQVRVDVYLPKNNHLYIKRLNSLSFNLPTEFAVKNSGWAVAVDTYPWGVEKDDDLILKGKGMKRKAGTYVISIFETKGKANQTNLKLKIKTQVCNSKTNICYRPQTIQKRLAAKASGKKRILFMSQRSSPIRWVTSYDKAFNQAKSQNKNVFVIITAPTWCGYCKRLERDVFSKSRVHSVLNKKFIPLRVLDSNPDKRKFSFRGYPTMYVMSPKAKILSKRVGRRESSFLSTLSPYENSAGGTEEEKGGGNGGKTSKTYSYVIQVKGKFVNKGKNWVRRVKGKKDEIFTEVRRDRNYAIIRGKKSQQYIAFPLRGKKGYIYQNRKWLPYIEIE
ncbi:MAG: thioredoxin family protein [Spirochaetota bacterium]